MIKHWESIALFLSILTNIVQIFSWWNTSERKKFAAENEFRTIAGNQQKILSKIEDLESATEQSENGIYRALSELRAAINALCIKLTDKSITSYLSDNDKKS